MDRGVEADEEVVVAPVIALSWPTRRNLVDAADLYQTLELGLTYDGSRPAYTGDVRDRHFDRSSAVAKAAPAGIAFPRTRLAILPKCPRGSLTADWGGTVHCQSIHDS